MTAARGNVVDFERVLKHTERPHIERAAATPFIKWAGGKRSLIPHLAPHFPDRIGAYWEPFLGGGAVFFTFANRIGQAVLSDTNEDLVITYQMVKAEVDGLIAKLADHESNHKRRKGQKYADGHTYYQRVRASEPKEALDVAARFIYLNKTCFNGLHRVNKSGQFNVPEGSYKNPDICNADKLRKASAALAKATIRLGDFASVVAPGDGDMVYCDPPYDGDGFTGYQADGFRGDSQSRLRDAAAAWADKGANVVLSNADTEAMRALYSEWRIDSVKAARNINCNGKGRQPVGELVISK